MPVSRYSAYIMMNETASAKLLLDYLTQDHPLRQSSARN